MEFSIYLILLSSRISSGPSRMAPWNPLDRYKNPKKYFAYKPTLDSFKVFKVGFDPLEL